MSLHSMALDASVLFMVSGVGLAFAGAATSYKDKRGPTNQIHNIGAGIAMVVALIAILVQFGNWIPLAICGVGTILMFITKIKNPIWWSEMIAIACIAAGLLIQ